MLEVVLELESLQEDLLLVVPKEDLVQQLMSLLERFLGLLIMTLKGTMSKGSLETLERINNGDMI